MMKLARSHVTAFVAGFFIFAASSTEAGVLLQGFYRDAHADHQSWWENLARKSHDLRKAGFTAVWIPPVLKGRVGGYSTGYDPFDDYDIGSKDQMSTTATHWGDRDELQRAVAVMRANGLDVYVDMVLNHRNGDPGDKTFSYKDAYGRPGRGRFEKHYWDFHRDDKQDQDADVPQDDTNFGPDLKHSSPYVSDNLKRAGDWLTKALDVQGYRLDYVKGISSPFLRDYLNTGAMAGKFAVGEYMESKRDVVDAWCRQSMQSRTSAFDFGLRDLLKNMCDGHGANFDMSQLDHAGLAGMDPAAAVTFVESHDTDEDAGKRIVSNKHLAYAYILTSEGYPTVFYRDYFEYGMKATIDNLVWIHEKIAEGGTQQRWKDPDVFAYERLGGNHLLAVINDDESSSRGIYVDTGFGANVQLHDYSGHAGDVWTDGNGKVWLTVPKNSYVAYSRNGIAGDFNAPHFTVTQEFAGASDLDIRPADNTEWVRAGRVYCEAHNTVHAELYFDADHWTQDTRIDLEAHDASGAKVASLTQTVADGTTGKMDFVPKQTGWFELRVHSFDTPAENQKPAYWLKVSYSAPQTLP